VSLYGLEELDRDECMQLVATQAVGRAAIGGDDAAVLPVVFGLLDGDVVFRTAPGQKLVAAVLGREIVFEVDAYDRATGTGWSVNIVGPASEIVHPGELERARGLDLDVWAGDARDRFVRVHADKVTGRRLAPS
jgi:nitroimidazol reductase NimA-like FMN-containing flavoprotein (pyridoxamine 5'-phosphate oxidase superfamily)